MLAGLTERIETGRSSKAIRNSFSHFCCTLSTSPVNMTVTVTWFSWLWSFPVESVPSCVEELLPVVGAVFADGDLVELDVRRGSMLVEIVYPA